MYGGEGGREMRPNFVVTDWKVAAEFVKDYKGLEEYAPVKVTLQCADGTKMEKPGATGCWCSCGAMPAVLLVPGPC